MNGRFVRRESPDAQALHFALVDAVNSAKTEVEHEMLYWQLVGFRKGLRAAGIEPDLCACDLHVLPTLCDPGVDVTTLRDVCCGVFIDWKPETAG